MNQLLEIKNYQERQEFVANNTEILTTPLEKEMQNSIYQEATELVQIESQAGWKCTSDDHHYVCGDFGCYGYSVAAFFPSDIQHYQTGFLKSPVILRRLKRRVQNY